MSGFGRLHAVATLKKGSCHCATSPPCNQQSLTASTNDQGVPNHCPTFSKSNCAHRERFIGHTKRRKEQQVELANLQQRLEEEQQQQELVFQQQRDEAARERNILEEQRRIWEEERCRLEDDAHKHRVDICVYRYQSTMTHYARRARQHSLIDMTAQRTNVLREKSSVSFIFFRVTIWNKSNHTQLFVLLQFNATTWWTGRRSSRPPTSSIRS